ncbi:dihydrolipoamide acetyltransferase family protein [Agromyces sp. MMS24-K17]|uniref:dihydrolipoamide acetyltransferase family protein n=1 Tax=Agromyces sp. MMS24-K17 TaxID=3372850 RepID=UPI0037546B03
MTAMIKDFALPDLGEGLTESEVVAWRVAVGDRIELNQVVADVETAKAVVELPSPFAGIVTALHAEPGQTVNVGEPLFSCDTGEGGAPDAPADADAWSDASTGAGAPSEAQARPSADVPPPTAGDADGQPERLPTLVGYGAPADVAPKRRARRSTASAPAPASVPAAGQVPLPSTGTERPRSTPPVRRLARDLGVDLAQLAGTGERGLITRADVEAAAGVAHEASARVDVGAPAAAAPASASADAHDLPPATRIPIAGVRKHTAAAMVRSAFTAPHVTEFLEVDVTATMELVRGIRDDRSLAGGRVTPLAVVAMAMCLAARRTPEVNSHWDEDAGEIVRYDGVNLGVAVATDRGLIVPNVERADRLGLLAVADAIADLAETARAGRTAPGALRNGTMTVTNVGVFGVDAGTPILNPGEAVILAVGAIRRRPWEHRGEVALREVVTLALSFDHRLVDGEQGSRFLVDVGNVLREPGRALTMMS